jgi:hypothetical protein
MDERIRQEHEKLATESFWLVIIALGLDVCYRQFISKQPADDLMLIVIGVALYRVFRRGIPEMTLEKLMLLRLPVMLLGGIIAGIIIVGLSFIVMFVASFDRIVLPTRIILGLAMLVVGTGVVRLLFRALHAVNDRTEARLAAAEEAEDALYSDEPVDAVIHQGKEG